MKGGSRLSIVAAAVLFSTCGAAIKLASLTSWQVAGFRALVAALAFLVFVPQARRLPSWKDALVAVFYQGGSDLELTSSIVLEGVALEDQAFG